MSEYGYKISAPLRNLITFNGSDGKPLLVIDGEKRRIEVSEGVDVSGAAQAVLTAIERLLPFARQEIATIRDEALEEAAQLCERVPGDPQHGDFFAKAIRALRDRAPT